jgi:hypothetical protein
MNNLPLTRNGAKHCKLHPNNPKVASELEDYLATGLSNGDKLQLQVMGFSSWTFFSKCTAILTLSLK